MVQDYPILRLRYSGNKLECELTDPISMQIVGIEYKFTKKMMATINKHYEEILRMTGGKEQPSVLEFKKELNKLGNEIGKVLKYVLKNLAFEIKKNSPLALALDDETVKIPWELGLLPGSLTGKGKRLFFCDVACVGRLRVVKAESWRPTSSRKSRYDRALVIGINYKDSKHRISRLEHAEEEAEKVKSILEDNDIHVTLLIGKQARLKSVMNELKKGVDILHFTGHGSTSRNKSKIYLYDKVLWAKDLENLPAKSAAPSLSFFNACETAVDIEKRGKIYWAPFSWAFALANQGGSTFIGTMWSVFEEDALIFAETFYKKFLGNKKKTLAEAMRQARNIIKRRTDGIFSWPAYVLYGPPTLKADDLFGKS